MIDLIILIDPPISGHLLSRSISSTEQDKDVGDIEVNKKEARMSFKSLNIFLSERDGGQIRPEDEFGSGRSLGQSARHRPGTAEPIHGQHHLWE